ncbi:MAG: GrpB family protein [Candidatus Sumerlaeota bacterium]|nr:GrpB family protein [Candidatus Sumerlaeota bacterium]
MLGLAKRTVKLVPYDARWPAEYKAEERRILAALGDHIQDIQHVGSTAVPGMAAKPVIDIVIALKELGGVSACRDAMYGLGYVSLGDYENRGDHLFIKGTEEQRTHHAHFVELGSRNWNTYVGFRDRLLSDPKLRIEYAEHKEQLAKQFAFDRPGYTAAKADFILSALGACRKTRRSGKDFLG